MYADYKQNILVKNVKLRHFGKKTWHFGKITGFTAFDENHGFHDFLLPLFHAYRL